MESLLKTMKQHGTGIPIDERHTQKVTSCLKVEVQNAQVPSLVGSDAEPIITGILKAIEKARDFFLFDVKNYFRSRNLYVKANVYNGSKEYVEALIIPPPKRDFNKVGIIYRQGLSHYYKNADGSITQVRLKYGVLVDGNETVVDPFDYRSKIRVENGNEMECSECFDQAQNVWKPCTFKTLLFSTDQEGRNLVFDGTLQQPIHQVSSEQVECPSMIFTYSPKEAKGAVYNLMKMCCQFMHGIPSQNANRDTYDNKFNHNMALKVNTKLSQQKSRLCAWSCEQVGAWIEEAATMVMGMDLSHGLGYGSDTVAVCSVGLESTGMNHSFCWRIMSKTHIVHEKVMADMTSELIDSFVSRCNCEPERVVFYRHGVPDSDFLTALDQECKGIRNAFAKRGKGEPKITFIVCQSNHGIKIVPDSESNTDLHPGLKRNVPSGTLVDDTIIDQREERLKAPPSTKAYSSEEQLAMDFFLVAQGGLKGTSRPMYYRILLNENANPNNDGKCTVLDKEKLQLLTYHQSFFYGTASKAIRTIPLVHYSTKLANTISGFKEYLLMENLMEKVSLDDNGQEDENNEIRDDSRYFYKRTDTSKQFLTYESRDGDIVTKFPIRPHFPA